MDDRSRIIGIVGLAVLAAGALVIMGIVSWQGRDVPAAVAAAFGTAIGALAGILSPRT